MFFFATTGKATAAFDGVKLDGQDFCVRFGSDMQKHMATVDEASSSWVWHDQHRCSFCIQDDNYMFWTTLNLQA